MNTLSIDYLRNNNNITIVKQILLENNFINEENFSKKINICIERLQNVIILLTNLGHNFDTVLELATLKKSYEFFKFLYEQIPKNLVHLFKLKFNLKNCEYDLYINKSNKITEEVGFFLINNNIFNEIIIKKNKVLLNFF